MSKDHVFILVSVPPNISLSDIMKRVIVLVSCKTFEEVPILKIAVGEVSLSRGVPCWTTSGELTKEMINKYLGHCFEKDLNDQFDIK